ncbi:MAG: 16S rRNA (adenine(1518)-N(6)/adenine(1519)-N(6))-dimethyltransferase RsmA [Oscillospiraceae bacterium]|nr:16S rRNA (adenine(1518)-N(6)/adenine(1519)-N(6))-dimethyltransferase RsmA [Oscillospiraceae bacterium]
MNDITAILKAHGFTFNRKLGQNFLVNPSVCPRMASLCGATTADGVLEIGPGAGVLTRELCRIAKKVVAIELDDRLPPVLTQVLAGFENYTLVMGDALNMDLHSVLSEHFADCERIYVCANLPYYITSPLLMKLLEERLPIAAVTAMVQKEAATRLCAPQGARDGGAVTCAVQYYAVPEILFSVSRGSFLPPPNVDSAVIRLALREAPPVCVADEAFFFRIIKAAFGQRRKTLCNALAAGLSRPKTDIEAALLSAGISPNARGEELRLADFAHIADQLQA